MMPALRNPGRHAAAALRSVGVTMVLCIAVPCAASPSMEEEVMLSAARTGNVALFRSMIKSGANPGACDDAGNNALVFAVQSSHEDMLREVLGHRVDLDARGSAGITALGIAIIRGATHTVERLLRAGADVNVPDSNGTTPLASAMRLGRLAIANRDYNAGSGL